jgi:hypothetical protein
MGSCEVFFLQMQPYLISHFKTCVHPMLITSLLVLGIVSLQNIRNLLLDVLDALKKMATLSTSISTWDNSPYKDAIDIVK